MKKAFTLIELLIVVAIIAILAAIAVPNFLEAQTRSKVSRCRADMRSIATALEAYRVDNTAYPTDGGSGIVSPINTNGYNRLGVITTPVAYITSIPRDVFVTIPPANRTWFYSFVYMCNNELNGYGTLRGLPGWNVPDYIWLMFTSGPDRTPDFANKPPYDSTNGTVSGGDIWYFGPGGSFSS